MTVFWWLIAATFVVAIALMDYFTSERARHDRSNEPVQILAQARELLIRLRSKPAGFFKGKVDGVVSIGKLTDKCGLTREPLDRERVLDVLIGRGWLIEYVPPPTGRSGNKGGRPTKYFHVHPALRQ